MFFCFCTYKDSGQVLYLEPYMQYSVDIDQQEITWNDIHNQADYNINFDIINEEDYNVITNYLSLINKISINIENLLKSQTIVNNNYLIQMFNLYSKSINILVDSFGDVNSKEKARKPEIINLYKHIRKGRFVLPFFIVQFYNLQSDALTQEGFLELIKQNKYFYKNKKEDYKDLKKLIVDENFQPKMIGYILDYFADTDLNLQQKQPLIFQEVQTLLVSLNNGLQKKIATKMNYLTQKDLHLTQKYKYKDFIVIKEQMKRRFNFFQNIENLEIQKEKNFLNGIIEEDQLHIIDDDQLKKDQLHIIEEDQLKDDQKLYKKDKAEDNGSSFFDSLLLASVFIAILAAIYYVLPKDDDEDDYRDFDY